MEASAESRLSELTSFQSTGGTVALIYCSTSLTARSVSLWEFKSWGEKKTRTAVLIFSMWKQFSQQCGFGTSRACVHVNPHPPLSVSLPNTTVISGMLQSEWTAEAEECWARPHPPAPHLQPSAGRSQRELLSQQQHFPHLQTECEEREQNGPKSQLGSFRGRGFNPGRAALEALGCVRTGVCSSV